MKFQAWALLGLVGSVMDKNKVRKKDMKSSSRKLTDHGNIKKLFNNKLNYRSKEMIQHPVIPFR
jgi:hypothetical protein